MITRGVYIPEADRVRQIHIKENPYLCIGGHFHEGVELFAVVQGEVEAYSFSEKEVLREGDLFFADSFDCHYYRALTPDTHTLVIVLGNMYTAYFREMYAGKTLPTFMKDTEKNKDIIALMQMWLHDEGKTLLTNVGYCNLLLSKIVERYPLKTCAEKKELSVSVKLLQYLNDHYLEDISLTSAGVHIGYSKEYCSKVFHETVGMGFRDYLNLLRLRQANKYMETKDQHHMTTVEIAYKCGFSSMATFYRVQKAFKEKILIYDTDLY